MKPNGTRRTPARRAGSTSSRTSSRNSAKAQTWVVIRPQKRTVVCVEPWGDEFILAAGQPLALVFTGPRGVVETAHEGDRITLFGWAGSLFDSFAFEKGVADSSAGTSLYFPRLAEKPIPRAELTKKVGAYVKKIRLGSRMKRTG